MQAQGPLTAQAKYLLDVAHRRKTVDTMLIIFDFDGTLADTWSHLADELVSGAEHLRYRQLDRQELEGLRRLETKAVFRALGVKWWQLPRVVAHLRRRASELAHDIKLFPGVEDAVVSLVGEGHMLAVVSTNSESTVRQVLGRDLSSCFRFFSCSASVFGKAAKFRKLRRLSGEPSSAIVAIGDETRDIDAAEKAGIASIAVEWGYNDPAILRDVAPNQTAASPAELTDMLLFYSKHGSFK